jgi:hypothetical protein
MNIHDLRQEQKSFDVSEFKKSRKHLHKLRDKFTKDFSIENLNKLPIDDYVIGSGPHSFCYRLERELDNLGRILGSPASKFGVYYSKKTSEYKQTKIWGTSYKEAYRNIKSAIIDLILAGKNEDINAIIENKLSQMFKGKILSIYYPNRYLNIFSDEHLNHYLSFFGLDFNTLPNPVYKRDVLVSFKNQDSIMRKWDNETFTYFLYSIYPKAPIKEKDSIPELRDYEPLVFPFSPTIEELNLTITPIEKEEPYSEKSKKGKLNYERENRKSKQLGDRGEEIVKSFEIDRLIKAGKTKLAKKIERVSLKSDSYGYDILSFNEDGTERHIEVKATQSKAVITNFFLTINELNTAKEEGERYFIYIVYEILTDKPKIWTLNNPFLSENPGIKIEPINFRIKINTEKF